MPQSDWTPTVADIGGRLGARTMTLQGKREGTFNTSTFPTAQTVGELIEDAVSAVEASVGKEVEEEYWPMLKTAAIYHTCMSIEGGYYPETTTQPDSAYTSFKDRFQEQIKNIETALNQKRPNERRIVSLRQESVVGIHGGRLDPWSNDLFP